MTSGLKDSVFNCPGCGEAAFCKPDCPCYLEGEKEFQAQFGIQETCGCGRQARYQTSSGWSCNKHFRCPTPEEKEKIDRIYAKVFGAWPPLDVANMEEAENHPQKVTGFFIKNLETMTYHVYDGEQFLLLAFPETCPTCGR